ncbi:N-succinylglutamate 5-semialdehyde dehydrogenase [Roseimaritima multifibrata]|uniref:L-glutamate gamma-semialdehyde dehydrogenase n=1 Tax=Roseimaritima multifibrata TaxID=1930274 RepID=A0A517MCP5_9BACT|nr:aldehyde dehydrogenase family protein [Roseimaritima multifibrata]QDS92651.1 N-succinylglutamate 5-semialdehyde dehydrogenase [Roseimaritima multifibrata]
MRMINTKLSINGNDVDGCGDSLTSRNPADSSLVFDGRSADGDQIQQAFAAAHEAQAGWEQTKLADRADILSEFVARLRLDATAIAEQVETEIGKFSSEANAEIEFASEHLLQTIAQIQKTMANVPSESTGHGSIHFRAIGVVLVIGAYCDPIRLPLEQIIPAILAGNSVVFKPSELTPAVGRRIVDSLLAAGLPAGVINLIQGDATVARAAIDDTRLNGLFVTGSRATGQAIHRQLGGRPEVLLAMRLGGNNPVLIASPESPQQVAAEIAESAFRTAGQRCLAPRRLIVIDDAAGRQFVDAFVQTIAELKTGLPKEPTTPQMGPLVSSRHANLLQQAEANFFAYGGEALVESSVAEGCGALVRPGLTDMTDCYDPVDEEWFGPLLQLYWVSDFQQGIERAAATDYGLAASLFGGDPTMFDTFAKQVPTGIATWNRTPSEIDSCQAWAGLKQSGNHRPTGAGIFGYCMSPIARD